MEAEMQQVTIHAAKTNLSKLIEAALACEEVVIAKGSTPVVRLVPVTHGAFRIGLLKGQLGHGPDVFQPEDEADLEPWEGGAD
jgi:prevent-host-death family protein